MGGVAGTEDLNQEKEPAIITLSLESGELALRDKFDKALPLSIVVRMTR